MIFFLWDVLLFLTKYVLQDTQSNSMLFEKLQKALSSFLRGLVLPVSTTSC